MFCKIWIYLYSGKTREINNNKFVVIVIMMSGFTFLRFRSKNMPNVEEDQRKDEIIKLIEPPETKDIEFNSRISRILWGTIKRYTSRK